MKTRLGKGPGSSPPSVGKPAARRVAIRWKGELTHRRLARRQPNRSAPRDVDSAAAPAAPPRAVERCSAPRRRSAAAALQELLDSLPQRPARAAPAAGVRNAGPQVESAPPSIDRSCEAEALSLPAAAHPFAPAARAEALPPHARESVQAPIQQKTWREAAIPALDRPVPRSPAQRSPHRTPPAIAPPPVPLRSAIGGSSRESPPAQRAPVDALPRRDDVRNRLYFRPKALRPPTDPPRSRARDCRQTHGC